MHPEEFEVSLEDLLKRMDAMDIVVENKWQRNTLAPASHLQV